MVCYFQTTQPYTFKRQWQRTLSKVAISFQDGNKKCPTSYTFFRNVFPRDKLKWNCKLNKHGGTGLQFSCLSESADRTWRKVADLRWVYMSIHIHSCRNNNGFPYICLMAIKCDTFFCLFIHDTDMRQSSLITTSILWWYIGDIKQKTHSKNSIYNH